MISTNNYEIDYSVIELFNINIITDFEMDPKRPLYIKKINK
jgi:hypothetical protein